MRHGEAENNVLSIVNSLPQETEEEKKYHLTDTGRQQIMEIAEFLKNIFPDAIFSSPVCRARESSEIIAEKTGLSVILDKRLCETGFGIFNNRPAQEFWEKYSQPESRLSPDPDDNVESFVDMRKRLADFLGDMQKEYAGKKVVVVSHGDPLEQLYGILTNEAPDRSTIGWYPKKGTYTEIEWKF